jgi:3-hydroxy-9,10-secoandrosta-1,3,5(10)-triene-9,17-dione monooxygenase
VNDFVGYVRGRASRGKPLGEYDAIQIKLAESDAEVDAARLLLRRNCIDNMAEVRRTGTLSLESRTRNRRDHAFAGKLCLQAVDRLHLACGAHGLYRSSPLQQAFRDMHAVAAHAVLTFETSVRQYGRVRLGLDLDDTFFV